MTKTKPTRAAAEGRLFSTDINVINKILIALFLLLFLSQVAFSQQEQCRVNLINGEKFVLYVDGTFKYIQGSKPISAGGTIFDSADGACGDKNRGKILLRPDGTWKHIPKPDLTKIEVKSFDEVTADRISIIDKPVRVTGTLKDSDSYFGIFEDKEATHFAFLLSSPSSVRNIVLYYPRGDKANELRAKMKANGNKLEGEFDIWFSTLAYESTRTIAGRIFAELLDYHTKETTSPSETVRPSADLTQTEKPKESSVPKSSNIYADMRGDDNHPNWTPVTFPETKGLEGVVIHAWIVDLPSVSRFASPGQLSLFVRFTDTPKRKMNFFLEDVNCNDKAIVGSFDSTKFTETGKVEYWRDTGERQRVKVGKKDMPQYAIVQWACTKAGFWN